MNRVSKEKLARLVQKCESALRDKHRKSFNILRGEMWAVIAAAHELQKRGVLRRQQPAEATDAEAISG